jgi:hypothetical protein
MRVVVFALWVLSIVATGVWVSAQSAFQSGEPQVLTGDDIGFRLEGSQANGPRGRFVVRVNGKWVDAQFVVKPTTVTSRE